NINKVIGPKLEGVDAKDQLTVDTTMLELDGTENKSKLGANSILGVSIAAARLAALSEDAEFYEWVANLRENKAFALPVPYANIINGGKHAGNDLKIQEFMVVPKGKDFAENARVCIEIYHALKSILEKKHGKSAINVGDEGGFAPPLKTTETAIEEILKAAEEAGHDKKISIALDCAASEFHQKGKYEVDGKIMDKDKLIEFYVHLAKKYPITSIEDPLAEDDFEGFTEAAAALKGVQVVGDDLLVTSTRRIRIAIENKCCSCLLLKANQIGTVTESLEAAKLALSSKWNVMVSHRSGETNDDFIADFAVGVGAQQIKLGAPCRGERVAKYNRLLEIEESL
ncbi:MAG: phosphopyruvate hydratase, partial [Candidatus Aenigmarchaeota archaeon]|nr:phosphopyruvate hydratase [Candidatus Aenigmarchaeota archaeon]